MKLESLWDEFSGRLGGFIRARVSDPAAAEDLRQEVFLKVHRRLGQLRDAGKIESWLFQIARRAITDYYRDRARRGGEEIPETVAGEGAAPTSTEREALHASVERLIGELPERYRKAVELGDLEGLPQAEVARRLGISLTAAKSRVQRGRAQLRELLLDCCRFEFDRRGGVAGCQPRVDRADAKPCPECDRP